MLVVAWVASLGVWLHALGWADLPGPWLASALAGLCLAAWTTWQWRRTVHGQLHWVPPSRDGDAAWHWESAAYRRGVPLDGLRCVIDGQSWLLLRVRTRAGLGLWLCLSRRQRPDDWGRLREAVKAGHRV